MVVRYRKPVVQKQLVTLIGIFACFLLPVLPAQSGAGEAEPVELHFNRLRFDPLQERPVPPEEQIQRAASTGQQIVQFTGPLTREQRRLLRVDLGLSLNRYLPRWAYLERLTPDQSKKLEGLDFFRWRGPYLPAYKLAPNVGARRYLTPQRQVEAGMLLDIVLFDHADLSAVAEELGRLGMDVRLRFDDRELGGFKYLRVLASDRLQLERAAALEAVEWIAPAPELIPENNDSSKSVQSGEIGDSGTTPVHDRGLHGEGQIIGIIDTTLDWGHCFFDDGGAAPGPSHRKVVGYHQDGDWSWDGEGPSDCEFGHGTHVAGTAAGYNATADDVGVAHGARISFGNLHDLAAAPGGGTRSVLDYFRLAHDDGAFIHSNSWKDSADDTTYTPLCAEVDGFSFIHEHDLLIFGAGNNTDDDGDGHPENPSPLYAPALAKNALTVVASEHHGGMVNTSSGSRGPTADGRRKPELYAPGKNVRSARAGSDCGHIECSGSSMSVPAVAGAAAMVRQYFTEGWYPSGSRQPHNRILPSGALLKAVLLNATRDMTGYDAAMTPVRLEGYPGDLEGWGHLAVDDGLYFRGDELGLSVWDVGHSAGLFTGDTRTYSVPVADDSQRLKVTLVWMDPPPALAALDAPVVNNLDLTLTGPDGSVVYLGNHFVDGRSAVGGAPDLVNNVEQILVPAPAAGEWTVSVTATEVNEGAPAQGFALVATAAMPEPPAPSGEQNTLVVKVRLPDADLVGITHSETEIATKMAYTAAYFAEISDDAATIEWRIHEPVIDLDKDAERYFPPYANPLIEMTEEVVSKLLDENPDIFEPGPGEEVERLVLVTNDPDYTGDWATTGPWPYDLPGGLRRRITVSIHSFAGDLSSFTHGLSHHFGMLDLYAHEGVHFDRPRANGWDNMARPFRNQHPLIWNKRRAGWVADDAIYYVSRPAQDSVYGDRPEDLNPIPLYPGDSGDFPAYRGILIGLSAEPDSMSAEQVYYFIEARRDTDSGFDVNLPRSGVLIYHVNEAIPQGEGPVWLLDANPDPRGDLADAAYQDGDTPSISHPAGISARIDAREGGGYDIHLTYDPPETDNDVNIRKGDYLDDGRFVPYLSPDIWVDSPVNGFDEDHGGEPNPHNDEAAVEDADNRLYFRIHNPEGMAHAERVEVEVRMSEPYQTLGDQPDFNRDIDLVRREILLAGDPPWIDFVTWKPLDDGEPHSCALVTIRPVDRDANTLNNEAQENIREIPVTRGSPFGELVHRFTFSNPYDRPGLFYMRVDGVPSEWTHRLEPRRALLAPGERIMVELLVQPPENARICSDHELEVGSWVSRGDTLVPVGGGLVVAQLREQTTLETETEIGPCPDQDGAEGPGAIPHRPKLAAMMVDLPQCAAITERGCTVPPRPFEEVVVRYEDPAGNPVFHTVLTDEHGCFEDFLLVAEGGDWEITATYPGSDCAGPGDSGGEDVAVPLPVADSESAPPGTHQPPFGIGSGCLALCLWERWIAVIYLVLVLLGVFALYLIAHRLKIRGKAP